MKLYYRDPIKAAYMAREFGVEIYYPEDSAHKEYTFTYHELAGLCESIHADKYPPPYHIHPDSLHIFEPQEGDMILFREKFGAYCDRSDGYVIPAEHVNVCDPCFTTMSGGKLKNKTIIQRNGKHFFMPKCEE